MIFFYESGQGNFEFGHGFREFSKERFFFRESLHQEIVGFDLDFRIWAQKQILKKTRKKWAKTQKKQLPAVKVARKCQFDWWARLFGSFQTEKERFLSQNCSWFCWAECFWNFYGRDPWYPPHTPRLSRAYLAGGVGSARWPGQRYWYKNYL